MRTMRIGPGSITPMVRLLLILNGSVFLLQLLMGSGLGISGRAGLHPFAQYFALIPTYVVEYGYVWQLITYQFLHGGLFHILINMLVLWMFGTELERVWGSTGFIRFYLTCGVAAGVSMILFHYVTVPTVGASGAIYGLLGAFALLWPDRELYLLVFFILPVRIKAKYLVALVGIISLVSGLSGAQSGIAHVAHLGGLAMGLFYAWAGDPRRPLLGPLTHWFKKRRVEKKKREWEQQEKRRQEMVDEADRILDRLRKLSWDELTEEEKRRIQEISSELKDLDEEDRPNGPF